MAVTLNANTSTGFIATSDTSGVLQLQTGGTAAVTIDASQKVGIGVTPTYVLDVQTSSTPSVARIQNITASSAAISVLHNNSSAGFNSVVYGSTYASGTVFSVGASGSALYTSNAGPFGIGTYGVAQPLTFSTNSNERMRIDSSGNVGIGTSSISSGLRVNVPYSVDTDGAASKWTARFSDSSAVAINVGGSLLFQGTRSSAGAVGNFAGIAGRKENATDNNEQGYLGFFTTPSTGVITERMRIDSSGNLLVGKSVTSIGTAGTWIEGTGSLVSSLAASTSASSTLHAYSTTASAYRFYVGMDGRVNATLTTISAISDERLKENIKDLDFGLSEVLSLKPRRFDWKEGKGADTKDAVGFIAQEFETVFPNSVGTAKAGEDGIEYKNICHDELIPTLVKAIQEQQAIIQTLTDRITALEGTTP